MGVARSQIAVPVLNPKRILVAEDDPAVGMLIEAVLSAEGYQVVLAADGEEAVRKYREAGPFELAMLDIHMPQLDGCGALKQIRAGHPGACALVLSGRPVEDAGAPPDWARGFDGFLPKPFTAPDLLRAVSQLLERQLRSRTASNAAGCGHKPVGPLARDALPG